MKILSIIFLYTLLNNSAFAAPHEPTPMGPPPKASIEACNGKTKEDYCDFTNKKGEAIKGTCFTPDPKKPLACRPHIPTH